MRQTHQCRRRLFLIILVCVLFVSFTNGCGPKNGSKQTGSGSRSQGGSLADLDRLYISYVNGDTNVAKRSLKEVVDMLQNWESPNGQALGLFLSYSRLYALEAREGDADLAEVYFIKARYWFVRNAEIGNSLPREIGAKMRTFTTNACIEMVDDWDRKHSDGKVAKYLRRE